MTSMHIRSMCTMCNTVSDSFDRVDFLFDNFKRCSYTNRHGTTTLCLNAATATTTKTVAKRAATAQIHTFSLYTSNRNEQTTTLTETTELSLILLCVCVRVYESMILETSDHIVRIQFMHIEFHLRS